MMRIPTKEEQREKTIEELEKRIAQLEKRMTNHSHALYLPED